MKQQITKMKNHVRENKKIYIAVGIGIVVGTVGAVALKDSPTMVSIKEIMTFKWHSPTTVQIIIPALGDPGNVVQCIETGTFYASQGQVARDFGVSATNVGNHLHGKIEDIEGFHFKVVGKAGHPLAG